jgi:hypothetical protein
MKLDQKLVDSYEEKLLELSKVNSPPEGDYLVTSEASNALFKTILGFECIGFGSTRTVYRPKYGRKVIKVCPGLDNISEFTLYQGVRDSPIANILAKSHLISENGHILVQDYMPFVLSEDYAYNYGSDPNYGGREDYYEFEQSLSDLFKFVLKVSRDTDLECDFHNYNLGFDRKGDVKIIDYAAALTYPVNHFKFDFETCIRALNRYNPHINGEYSVKIDSNENLILSTPFETVSIPRKEIKKHEAAN